MTKAVLFDFDETLQNRTEAFEKYMDTFFNDYLPNLSKEELQKRKKDMVETGNGGYVNREEWYENLAKMWAWNDAPSKTVLANHYDTKFGFHNVIFDESIPLLKELQKRGIKTGIVTNGPSILQHTKLDNSGFNPYLDIVVVSGDINIHKPDKRIFEYAAKELALETKDCVYVGDHPINDIKGAKSSGMRAIRMNFGWFKDKDLSADVPTVENIYDVLKYI